MINRKKRDNLIKSLNRLDDPRLKSAEISRPFVTVIVTNYNYAKYIIPCLKSVDRQTYEHYKCIIVDDCSTDESVKLIGDFIKTNNLNNKFSLIRHEKNLGQMAAIKTGLKHAGGAFVVFLDSDDILLKDFLTAHIQAHMDKTVAFTSSNQCQISENGEIIAGTHDAIQTKWEYIYLNPRDLHNHFWIWATTSSMMFRRSVMELIMPDETEDFPIFADTYICHFSHLIGGSMIIPKIHGCYRRHGSNSFSCNPVVSDWLHIGDMNRHPKHQTIRLSILSHFLKNYEKFAPLMDKNKFILMLLRLIKPIEIIKIKREYPLAFSNKSSLFTLKLLILSLFSRLKHTKNKYCSLIKHALRII